jgi:hypothetical protein
LRIVKNSEEKKKIFDTGVTFETFSSSSQNLKVTRLQGGLRLDNPSQDSFSEFLDK